MHWIDGLIMIVPVVLVTGIALKARRYVTGVADFLTAGRVAGRYVVSVANGEAVMGLVSLIAMFELYYSSGFALAFWGNLVAPVSLILGLTGFCVYRFRETRAMTLGQFFELRYSKSFRIFAAVLQSISGILNYAIFPAVGARFFLYYADLPLSVSVLGLEFSTFGLLMAAFLATAVLIVTLGGQLTILVTDCVQGLLSYPMYVIVVVYLFYKLSWADQIAPTLLDRPPGASMLNPYDIANLRDFNLVFILVGLVGGILNRMSWSGTQGFNTAAASPHEQKMGNVLGSWRAGFSGLMFVLLAMAAYTFLHHPDFADAARDVRAKLAVKTLADVAPHAPIDPATPRDVQAALKAHDPGRAGAFGTIYHQMQVPMALRSLLPIGITGVFCAIMIFLMVSTDTAYLHSWGSILVQDLILPFRKKPFTPRQHLFLLRLAITLVAVFAFFFSFFFSQIDYILMFFAITGAIWLGGAGPCIVLGLYWKRGTTAGAFGALIGGSILAAGGIVLQQTWMTRVYPFLLARGWTESLDRLLQTLSAPLHPYVVWTLTPEKFPINSQELYLITMLVSLSLYVGLSWLTGREAFNMDRLLHRGPYRREGCDLPPEKFSFQRILGIDAQYTRGDRILAWSVFLWSFVWGFGGFLVLVLWNAISPWPNAWWAAWFFWTSIVLGCVIGTITTIWFTLGGTWDLVRLFRRLQQKPTDLRDDGRVIDHVSADDLPVPERHFPALARRSAVGEDAGSGRR